jgi:hypothetical protein
MGTPKGDVYSFAVIAQEILYRRGVFYLTEEDREAVYPIIDLINSATSRSSNDSSSKSRSASQKNHNNGIVAPPMSPTEYDDYDNYPVSIAAVAAAVAAQAQDVAQPRRRKITSRELVEGVKRGIRPSIDPSVCCREIADLLKKCWSEIVYERPDFTVIRDVMRKSTKYKSLNYFFSIFEAYLIILSILLGYLETYWTICWLVWRNTRIIWKI